MHDAQCIFCTIVERKIATPFLWEDEHVIVIADRFPQAPVHNLIISKLHRANVLQLVGTEMLYGSSMIAAVQYLAQQHHIETGFKLLSNAGQAAGQTVFHLHTHFLLYK